MAHFFGEIQGQRGSASRLGGKDSGLTVTAASWQGAVQVRLGHDFATGQDIVTVELKPWHSKGRALCIFRGPVSGEGAEDALAAILDAQFESGKTNHRPVKARFGGASDALQELCNIVTHPQATKAQIRQIAGEAREFLAKTRKPRQSAMDRHLEKSDMPQA